MEKVKEFILSFFAKEAECWNYRELGDLNSSNKAVEELYSMAIDDLDESFGILKKSQIKKEENPVVYPPRHFYKLSAYKNTIYGDIWVAYTSSCSHPSIGTNVFFEGFIISEIEGELKIIGTMITNKNRSTMKITGWKGSVYNPADLDIKKLGDFLAVERYTEPENYDNFSLKEYLKDS